MSDKEIGPDTTVRIVRQPDGSLVVGSAPVRTLLLKAAKPALYGLAVFVLLLTLLWFT